MNHFLLNVETTFGAATITTDFFLVFVVAAWVLLWDWVGKLYFGNLEVVGVVAGGVSTNEEAVGGVVLARVAEEGLLVMNGRGSGGGVTFACQGTTAWLMLAIPVQSCSKSVAVVKV